MGLIEKQKELGEEINGELVAVNPGGRKKAFRAKCSSAVIVSQPG